MLEYLTLDGDIIQTHLLSPRSCGYMCALLATIKKRHCYYVYGAGNKLNEYKKYIELLKIDNLQMNAEYFRNAISSINFVNVVCVFLTPPNSYSAVKDPIDLICSRGGDLSILEMLTETEMNDSSKQRVTQILLEQSDCLKLSMSKPQIQFILYETYSIIGAENIEMVKNAINDYNKAVQEKHLQFIAVKENAYDTKDLLLSRKKKLGKKNNTSVDEEECSYSSKSDGDSNSDTDVSIIMSDGNEISYIKVGKMKKKLSISKFP